MAQVCRVCTHPDIDEISRALVSSAALSAHAERFGVSVDSLRRHKRNHWTPALGRAAADEQNTTTAFDVYAELRDLLAETKWFVARCREKDAMTPGSMNLRERRQTVELIAKVVGMLDERAVTIGQVNVIQQITDSWVLAALEQALAPYPGAIYAAARVFDGIDLPVIDAEVMA